MKYSSRRPRQGLLLGVASAAALLLALGLLVWGLSWLVLVFAGWWL